MSGFPIVIIRLILSGVFGILIGRIFRPEWGFKGGILIGVGLFAAAYLMQMFRHRNSNK